MKELFKKYREIIVYIIVGLLTTVVAYGVRFAVLIPVSGLLGIDLDASSGAELARASTLRTVAVSAGWVAGVIFAFFTNKKWVFRDTVAGKSAWGQFGKFTLSRLGTYFIEWGLGVFVPMALIALGYRSFKLVIEVTPDVIATGVSVVLVTVLNYILSKLLVFRGNKEGKDGKEIRHN